MSTAGKKSATPPLGTLPTMDDLRKMVEQFKLPGIDVEALMEWQRKDMEALAEAQRQAVEGLQALATRRNEILRDSLTQWQSAMTQAGDPNMLTKQAEAARQNVQKAVDSFRELAQMEAATRANSWKVVQDRMQENMKSLQSLLQPKSK